jgi:hypothetical protein
MAGLLLLGGVLAVLGGVLGSGGDEVDGVGQVLWLAGVMVGLIGVGAGGYSLVTTAPYWLRLVASGGSAGLAAVVLTAAVPDLVTGAGGAIATGVLSALVGAVVYVVERKTAQPA